MIDVQQVPLIGHVWTAGTKHGVKKVTHPITAPYESLAFSPKTPYHHIISTHYLDAAHNANTPHTRNTPYQPPLPHTPYLILSTHRHVSNPSGQQWMRNWIRDCCRWCLNHILNPIKIPENSSSQCLFFPINISHSNLFPWETMDSEESVLFVIYLIASKCHWCCYCCVLCVVVCYLLLLPLSWENNHCCCLIFLVCHGCEPLFSHIFFHNFPLVCLCCCVLFCEHINKSSLHN